MILQLHHREGCVLITITTKSSFIITTPREHLTMNRSRKRRARRRRRRRRRWRRRWSRRKIKEEEEKKD